MLYRIIVNTQVIIESLLDCLGVWTFQLNGLSTFRDQMFQILKVIRVCFAVDQEEVEGL